MHRVAGFLALLVLAGCSQVQLEHQTDSFNRATGNAIGEQALLNAVRASLDMPMSFTKLLKFTGSNMASGTVTPKLPFGGDALRIFDLGPSVSISSGVGQIEYADANNSGALAKLNENLQYDAVDRYAAQGLNPGLLMTVLVEHAEIHSDLLSKIHSRRQATCANPTGIDKDICDELKTWTAQCAWKERIFDSAFALEGGYQVTGIQNRAETKCDFLRFQAFIYYLNIGGYWSDLITETTDQKLKTPEGTLLRAPKRSSRQGIRFEVDVVQREYDRIEKEFKRKAGKKGAPKQALYFTLRSPKSVLSYLGELIALQNFSKEQFVPRIGVGEKKVTVFKVVRGAMAPGQAAIAVRGPDGEFYSVPWPAYGLKRRDQTLRVLAIAGELVNGALSDKDFPAPASVVVRSF